MLAVKAYPQDYIDDCRSRMDAQLAAYDAVRSSASRAGDAAISSFEPLFLNDLVLVLDQYFVHRTRAIEGKDGNPLNEVRMLCGSILHDEGTLSPDKTIKYTPETSVLKLGIGDEIRLDVAQFRQLCDAFFTEIERRFTAS